MKKFNQTVFIVCGLLLMLAATSVFAQEEAAEFRPNKKPLDDFAQNVGEKVESKQVDLTKSFSIELTGDIAKDGKLDPKTAKFTKSEGDAAMIEVGRSFLAAFNNSGLFFYLKQTGIEKIKFVLGQDEARTYGVITSEMPTEAKAKTIAGGINLLFSLAKTSLQQRQNNENETILVNGASVGCAGRIFTLKMDYEKSVIQEMISRELKKIAAKQSNDE